MPELDFSNNPLAQQLVQGYKDWWQKGGVSQYLPESMQPEQSAEDVAMSFGPGNLGIGGIIAGQNAIGAPLRQLERAQLMEKQGSAARFSHLRGAPTLQEVRQNIWQETGWFRDVDGRWKYEIQDFPAELKPGALRDAFLQEQSGGELKRTRVGVVLQHPELYKAYPDLGELGLRARDLPESALAENVKGYGITVSPKHAFESHPSELKKTLLHELQHGVQDIEGFGQGGSWEKMYAKLRDSPSDTPDLYMQEAQKSYANALRTLGLPQGLNPANIKDVRLQTRLKEVINRDLYNRLQGEVESRNVENRAEMLPEYNRVMSPYDTSDVWDVPASERIVVDRTGRLRRLIPVDHDPWQR